MYNGNGAPGKIRTPDPLIRSQVLYPAELPVLFRPKQDQINDLCLNAYQQLGKSWINLKPLLTPKLG